MELELDRIRYEVSPDGRVVRITLDRPEKLNALTGHMRTDLLRALETAAADGTIRVVVIAGAGRAFCAGGDVADMAEMKEIGASEDPVLALMAVGGRVIRTIRSMGKPVVALIDGPAAGAGAALACACDLRWATDRAMFVFSWSRLGMHPDWGATWTLPRLVGPSRAHDWMLVGDPVGAEAALAAGLVSRLLPTDRFQEETDALIERLAAGPPGALARIKANGHAGIRGSLDAALQREMDGQADCWNSEDCAEGITAFGERRPPVFSGD